MLTQALKARKARLADEKGFTLIELLAVIVILAIIAVIAIPLIGNIIDNSKEDGDIATARQIYDAARLYVIGEEGGDFTKTPNVTVDILQETGYLDNSISLPSTKATITSGEVVFGNGGELLSVTLNAGSDIPKGSVNGLYSPDQVLSSDVDKTAATTPDKENPE